MGRSIVTAASIAAAPRTRAAPGESSKPAPVADDYSDALLKLIPAEVIGLYLSMHALMNSSPDLPRLTPLYLSLVGATLTFFFLRFFLGVSNTRQVIITVGAFCVWTIAINSPFSDPVPSWLNFWSGILVMVYTFVAPKIPLESKPKKKNKKEIRTTVDV